MMRILLADDQCEVRSALRLLLEQEAGGQVELFEAADMDDLLSRVSAACPDLILLDWELPGLQVEGRPASAAIASIRSICGHAKAIVLSGQPEAEQQAIAAGAYAFVSKGEPPEKLLASLRSTGLRV